MLLDQVPVWSVGTQLVLAGGAAYVVVDRLHRATRPGTDRSAPWVAWFAFVLCAGLVANVWVLSAQPEHLDQVAFVRSVLLIATAITLVPVAARLAGVHVPRWAMWSLAVARDGAAAGRSAHQVGAVPVRGARSRRGRAAAARDGRPLGGGHVTRLRDDSALDRGYRT